MVATKQIVVASQVVVLIQLPMLSKNVVSAADYLDPVVFFCLVTSQVQLLSSCKYFLHIVYMFARVVITQRGGSAYKPTLLYTTPACLLGAESLSPRYSKVKV